MKQDRTEFEEICLSRGVNGALEYLYNEILKLKAPQPEPVEDIQPITEVEEDKGVFRG